MNVIRKIKPRPWMILYAALLATMGVASEQGASLSWDAADVSPVSLETSLQDVRLDSIVRRSDI